ncbi:hypothetical protein ARMGADRAFT_1067744 [Armillaria gallica]|uniref:Uncharacterized protein n=1 Tax=Armillaria gallica TaxID=47427 RepID=A0A2H3D7G6_ARMGA|nr:hypothetical protein ARMGADRAFT_1067744 [Armillaria gallica]
MHIASIIYLLYEHISSVFSSYTTLRCIQMYYNNFFLTIYGSHVSFYDSTGQLVTHVIKSTSQMADGTQLVTVRRDNGNIVVLPP